MKATLTLFLSSLITQLSLTLARPTFQITVLAQPIVLATISYMILQHSGKSNDSFTFAVLGSGIAGIWASMVYSSAGDINRERSYGTLSSILGAPSSLLTVMLGKVAANGLLSLLAFAVSILYSAIVLHVAPRFPHAGAFVVAFALFVLGANLFALTLSSIFLLSRGTTVLQNFLEYPIMIVSGLFFSVQTLPQWAHPLGWPVPLTWGAILLRSTMMHSNWNTAAARTALGIEAVLICFYLALATILFHRIEYRVRITATLDVY